MFISDSKESLINVHFPLLVGQAYTQSTTQSILHKYMLCCVCVCPLWSSSSPTSWCAIAWPIKRCITLIYIYIYIYIYTYARIWFRIASLPRTSRVSWRKSRSQPAIFEHESISNFVSQSDWCSCLRSDNQSFPQVPHVCGLLTHKIFAR